MNEKEQLLKFLEQEFPRTEKIFEAFPAEQLEYQPHPSARSAKSLMLTIIGEEAAMKDLIEGTFDPARKEYPVEVESVPEIISRFKANHMEVIDKLKNAPDEEFNQSVDFLGQPIRRIDAMWTMLLDSIYHRGQFSIYVRATGGQVPDIYGRWND